MRKLTLSLAVMAALLPGQVVPLGLGEIELDSALNQELKAEIEVLSAAPEDAEQLIVKLASREAFARAGIDRPFSLQDIKFKTVVKGDKPYIQVYTVDPVREPFLSFLVEVDWPNGHLLREYTLLLDPPIFNTNEKSVAEEGGDDQAFFEPADVSAEPAATDLAEAPVSEEVVADAGFEPAPSAQSMDSAAEAVTAEEPLPVVAQNTDENAVQDTNQEFRPAPQYSQQVSGQYRVQETDTLWTLAEKLRPNTNVSVEQMMLALVHENPESFIKENINGLKRGYILRMPDRANITTVDRQLALEQVRQHNALWREYRQSMSASVPASAMEADESAVDANAAESTDGRLSIVSAAGAAGSEASFAGQDPKSQVSQLKRELSVARESLESERLEKENLRERLADLEQRVQRVLEMDDAELAKLQADLAGTKKQAEKITKPAGKLPASPVAEPEPAEKPAAPVAKGEQPAGEQPLFVDETTAAQEPAADTPVAETEAEPAEPMPAPPMVQQPPAGMFDNPVTLAIIGGGAVLVAALGALVLRRRRVAKAEDHNKWADMDKPINFDEAVEAVGEPYVKQHDTAAMQAVAPEKPSAAKMEDTVISLPGEEPAAAEAEVRDDVLAEADVYLAYGIYQQAEELLRNALTQHPERDDYRMKLLETHFASKNASAFAELAAEAKQRKGSVKSYWDRVVVMGRELCPDNAMFSAGAAVLPGFDADDLLPHKPQTTDFELDAGGMAPDLDLGFTEAPAKPSSETAEPDFSLDTESTMIMQQPLEMAASSHAPAMEFDLAADLENIANAMELSAQPAPAKAADMSADLDLGELDFSAESLSMDTAASAGGGIDEDFALDFEASDLGLATEDATDAVMDTSLDLAMDMDIGDLSVEAEPAKSVATLDMGAAADDDFDISQLAEDVDEVGTKLDLARAYMDMGDNEGARNILEEVKAEGNAAQKKQAEELLAKAG